MLEKMAKIEPVQVGSIGEIIVYSGFKQMLCVPVRRRKLVYMNDQ